MDRRQFLAGIGAAILAAKVAPLQTAAAAIAAPAPQDDCVSLNGVVALPGNQGTITVGMWVRTCNAGMFSIQFAYDGAAYIGEFKIRAPNKWQYVTFPIRPDGTIKAPPRPSPLPLIKQQSPKPSKRQHWAGKNDWDQRYA